MRLTKLTIKNFRSFDPAGQEVLFPTHHCALVGKNNSGKSNIFLALGLMFGAKNPSYAQLEDDDFFDATQPLEIAITITEINEADKQLLFSLPNLTKQQKGALNGKIQDGSANISFLLKRTSRAYTSSDETDDNQDIFEINLWGFSVYRKKEEVRKMLIRTLLVPSVRNYRDELTASRWTSYGELMKDVLENSPHYDSIKSKLSDLNTQIQQVFAEEKGKLLQGARIVSYVDDISFQLTKDNNPSELLRNLEIFISEGSKQFNIDHVGTGSQSAIIIGILELALKKVNSTIKLFCIEEPEAYIHPHGVRYLSTLVKNISDDQNTQVLISTHSLSLTANFEPADIIRIDKVGGKSVVVQDASLSNVHLKRFIHQDNAEMFFSDRLLFVEGATEKLLFNSLDKITRLDPADSESNNCNFDRINLGIIKMDSVKSILNYIKIAKAFKIPFSALVDKDLIDDPSNQSMCRDLCNEVGINFQTTNINSLISDFQLKNILVNPKGEIEDLFPISDIATISGKSQTDIQAVLTSHTKTSKAFKEIFNCGKPEYSIKIADYYLNNPSINHPLEQLIRNIYNNDIPGISF